MAAITGLIFLALTGPVAAGENNTKWFVCKYVDKPGVNESLQKGQNPISVSENAINQSPVTPGTFFEDSHGRSYVLVQDIGQPEPDVSECPGADSPEISLNSAPCEGVNDTPRIRILGLILGLHLLLDGNEVVPDADGFVDVTPGPHNWSVVDANDEEVASGQLTVEACPTSSTPTPEGSQLGGTGTPAPSLPNSALSVLGFGGPLATLLFGAILLSSLGALAYANVRASRSRR